MLYDEQFYLNRINLFKKIIVDCFGDKVTHIDYRLEATHYYFKIEFIYLPLNYKIIIENEKAYFNIYISDLELFQIPLASIRPQFQSEILDYKAVQNSIFLLKDVLEENNFYLYKVVGEKVFKRSTTSPDVLIRVKDVFKDRNQMKEYYRELYSPKTSD